MYIYLDDYREPQFTDIREDFPNIPHDQWVVVRDIDQFKQIVRDHLPDITHIAFDHDLSDQHYHNELSDERTGYDCAKFLVEECMDRNIPLPGYSCHSMNPAGRANILGYLNSFETSLKSR